MSGDRSRSTAAGASRWLANMSVRPDAVARRAGVPLCDASRVCLADRADTRGRRAGEGPKRWDAKSPPTLCAIADRLREGSVVDLGTRFRKNSDALDYIVSAAEETPMVYMELPPCATVVRVQPWSRLTGEMTLIDPYDIHWAICVLTRCTGSVFLRDAPPLVTTAQFLRELHLLLPRSNPSHT